MIEILHIVPDSKFIDDVILVFDSVSNTHCRYVCPVADSHNYELSFINYKNRVEFVSNHDLSILLQDRNVDIAAFHTLPYDMYKFVLQARNTIKIWWLVWGYDIYTDTTYRGVSPIIPLNLYKEKTKLYIQPELHSSCSTLQYVKSKIKMLLNYNGTRDRELLRKGVVREVELIRQQVLGRIDFLSTVLPLEYKLLSKLNGVRARYIPFQYPFMTKESTFIKDPEASYVLVGNSSDSSNNHLDVICHIRGCNINNIIYIPLAYGDEDYKKFLKERLDHANNIIIQDKMVPRDEYMSIIGKCKVAIFGHIRQQALANIGMAMMLGLKVFFYKDSICYRYFKDSGYFVYSIESDLSAESINKPLSSEKAEANRVKISKMFSCENVQQEMNNFFDKIII